MTDPRNRYLIAALVLAAGALAVLESAPAPAGEGQALKAFRLRGKPVQFYRFASREIVVSKSCLGPSGAPDCEAVRSVARATLKKVQQAAPGYQLGRDVCILVGGEAETGEDESGKQEGFCLFRDGSWISDESLQRHAIENDKLSRVK